MSKNNTTRRKAKKKLDKLAKAGKLYPYQYETLKAMLNQNILKRNLRLVTASRQPGMNTLRDVANQIGIIQTPPTVKVGDLTIQATKVRSGETGILPLIYEPGAKWFTWPDHTIKPTMTQEEWDKFDVQYTAAHAQLVEEGPPERDQFGAPVWPDWVILKNGRHPRAGEYGALCYRTACQRPNAIWWNRGSYHYYCEDCAHLLNRENRRSWRELQEGRSPEHREEGEMCILIPADQEDKPTPQL